MLAESANSVNDDVKNTAMLRFGKLSAEYAGTLESAPRWVLRLNDYKLALDVLDDIIDYIGYDEAIKENVQDYVESADCGWDVKVADGVVRPDVMKDEDGDLWINRRVSDNMKRDFFDSYELESYYMGYLGDSEDYENSEQYQQDKIAYYNAMGLSL